MRFKRTLPALILKTLSSPEPKHGYRIAQEIKAVAKGVLDFREGTLYPALHDLENQGLLESFEAPENGRMRRFYRFSEDGRKELAKERNVRERFAAGVRLALEGA